MAKKNDSNADRPKPKARKNIEITGAGEPGRAYAEFMTGGPMVALRIMRASEKSAGYEADLDYPALLALLREHGEAVNAGNLQQAEAMLINQATALQTVFARLVERGMSCTEIPAFEMNLRMGLRAQAQCRATLETLAAIKNPPSVAFVRQANIAAGPQQVNNGVPGPVRADARARKIESTPTKLSGGSNELRQDTGASALAGRGDPQMEAVGEIDRAEDAGRQS